MKYQKVVNLIIVTKSTIHLEKWVEVEFENGTQWLPSFVSLGGIVNRIGYCEDIKYPHGKGGEFAKQFLVNCFVKNKILTRSDIEQVYKNFNPNNLPYGK